MKLKKFIITVFLFIVFVSCETVKAETIEMCEMSDEYREWLNLEDKKNYIEPEYCRYTETNSTTSFVSSYFDIVTSSQNDSYYNASLDGYITNAKNQHDNNACWAFMSTSLLETQALKNNILTIDKTDFSESHLFYNTARDAFTDVQISDTYNRFLSSGGNSGISAAYFFNGHGPIYESDFPFSENVEYTPMSFADNYAGSPLLNVDEYISRKKQSGSSCDNYVDIIKSSIIEYGSVGVNLLVESNYYSSDESHVYYRYNGDSNVPNHSVTIVGWDDNISKTKFASTSRVDGAWIAKNSWGPSFGDNGYFLISYDDNIVCREIVNFTSNRLYDYDYNYSSSSTFGNGTLKGVANKPVYVSAKFSANNSENLEKVSFAVTDDVNYTAYLSKDNDLTSDNNWINLGSGHATYSGIKSLYFDPKSISEDFTIIIKYENPNPSLAPQYYAACSLSDENSFFYNLKIEPEKNYVFIDFGGGNNLIDLASQVSSEHGLLGCRSIIYAYTKQENVTTNNEDYIVQDGKVFVNLNKDKELSVGTLLNNISIDGSYSIKNSDNASVTGDNTKIGTNYKIIVDDKSEYKIIVSGDTNGDGKINYLDYVKVYNHIQKTKHPEIDKQLLVGEYLLAADMSKDNKISYMDYVKIYNKIKELKGGTSQ